MKSYPTIIGIVIIAGLFCIVNAPAEDQKRPDAELGYSDARIFNNNGVGFVSQGKHSEAAGEFQKALAVDPDFHIARYNLALAYYNMGKTKEAISEFEYLVNGSYYFVNARYNLGTIYLREGMTDKALEQLKVVVELQPEHAEAHFNLGYIYYKKNLLDDAIAEYEKGLKTRPDAVKGHLSLALLYEKKARYKEALDEYSAASQLQPGHQEAKEAKSAVQAIIRFKEQLNITPNDAPTYVHLGHIYYGRGMYQEAIDSYTQALRCDPDNQAAKDSLEKAVMKLNDNP